MTILKKQELLKVLLCVLLSFSLGLILRTAIISSGEQKILLYETFQPTYTIDFTIE